MGCLESKEETEAKKKNAEIEREMARVKEADAKTIKLLLLGKLLSIITWFPVSATSMVFSQAPESRASRRSSNR